MTDNPEVSVTVALTKTNQSAIADQAVTNSDNLTNAQLTKLWGFKSTSAVGNAAARGLDYFREWSKRYDSDGRPWEFVGENKDRRFYRT